MGGNGVTGVKPEGGPFSGQFGVNELAMHIDRTVVVVLAIMRCVPMRVVCALLGSPR
jgi:hypothetical protein